jgi:hypothetical protein
MDTRHARRWLYASGFVRAMATSTAGVTLGGFLSKLDAHGAELGLIVSTGLAGGAALILEQAALPGLAPASERTQIIARYTMVLDLGHALGALAAGAPAWLIRTTSLAGVEPHRLTLLACGACGIIAIAIYSRIASHRPRRLPAAHADASQPCDRRADLVAVCDR